MNKSIVFLILLLILFHSQFAGAQAPPKMSYQAVIRDASGALVKSSAVGVKFSILKGSITGTPVYEETQTITTNTNGLISAVIGDGAIVIGTMIAIDWSSGPYFIKTETDPTGGSGYTISSTTQLLSVPYALYAEKSGYSIIVDTLIVLDTVFNTCWGLKGNVGINPDSNFIGTKDDKDIVFKRNNINAGFISVNNIAFGQNTMKPNHSVYYNVAFGTNTLTSNTTGGENTAIGHNVLLKNTVGAGNTAIGRAALSSNVSGGGNVAIGYWSLLNNTTGSSNTACGTSSLVYNTTGNKNVSIGSNSMVYNTSGFGNTATGVDALANNLTGEENVANGIGSLYNNLSGNNNIAIGHSNMRYNTTGSYNTSVGAEALNVNNIGSYNTTIGYNSLVSNKKGKSNVAVGFNAYFLVDSLNNTICLGSSSGGVSSASNRAEIGNPSISWIGGQVSWSTFSDKRIKKDIKENVPGLAFINKLRPVTYHIDAYKQYQILAEKGKLDTFDYAEKFDIEKITQTGFIAQEVADAAKSTGYDFSGVDVPKNELDLYSVRYSDFVMPLVKAVQEQQALIEKQQALLEKLEKRIAELEAKK